MADNSVFITGAAEGAFAEALNGIPPWATQKTVEDIEKVLNKLLGIQAKALAQAIKCCKGAGGDGSGNSKTVNDELEKLAKNLKRINEEDGKKKKREKDEDKEGKDELGRSRKKRAADELWVKSIGALTGAGAKILEVQKQYFTTSEDLFKSGVNLLNGNDTTTSSMMSLNQIVTLTGLRLETFQKVVEKYTSSINAIGINKFAKTISLTNTRLISLGYNSEQQAELIGTLIESESSYADIRGKSSEQLANDAVRLGNQMTRLSILTGQSSAQLQENLKSLAKNTDSTVVAAVYGEKAAERLNTFAASFKDADVGVMFQKLAAATQPAITKTFQSLAQAGQAPLAEEFTRIAIAARDGAISAEQAQKQTTDLAQRVNSTTLQSLALLADKGVEGAAETLSVITKLRAQGNTTSKATNSQVDAVIESQASVARFSTALEDSKSLMQRTFPLLETQVNLASSALEEFNAMVKSSTDIFSAETRSWIGIGLEVIAGFALVTGKLTGIFDIIKGAAGFLWDGISTVGRGLFSLLNPIAKVAAAFAVGYSIGTLLNKMLSNFDWFNSMMDKIFSGLDHILKYIPGFAGDAKARIETKEKLASTQVSTSDVNKSKISIPKEPAQTTIISPSAVPPETTLSNFASATPALPNLPPATAMDKSSRSNEINSTLTYQTAILTQILEASQNLVSVNRDILKYAKVHS